MKMALFAFFMAGLLIVICTPESALAKAPTVKITISGGDLVGGIEVTNPQILRLSDAWSGQFLDSSRSPENNAPQGLRSYEISFYAEIAKNDVRKIYVGYYYPNSSTEQGFIYLPGSGPVRSLNVGTIIREGRDGKWNYASPAWEALIKPLIARATTQVDPTAKPKVPVQENRKDSQSPQVTMDRWTKPQPGWLYVLDPRSESDVPGSRIWLLDPETQKIMGSVQAGYEPDFALSPDGSRLYVASGERESGELAAIDTATGKVVHVPFPDRILYKPWYEGLPPYSRMEVSRDGRVLWILGHHLFSPEKVGYQLWTFDTRSERFLRARVSLGNCGYGEFVDSSTPNQLIFSCPTTNGIRLVQLDSEYGAMSNTLVKFPWPRTCGVAEGFLSSRENAISIIRPDGAIYELDTATQRFSPMTATDDCQQLIASFQWPRSPEGAKVYLGYGPLDDSMNGSGMATSKEIRALDTATWHDLGSLQTSVPFWSAAASTDGRLLYAIAPEQQSVLVIDAATMEEKQTIHLGNTPSLALVAP
jgi:hypothetical protein